MHRTLIHALAFLLVPAALAPTALGHDDDLGRAGDVDDGVAGTFVGAAAYFVEVSSTPVSPPFGPDFLVTDAWILCDHEVLGDAQAPDPLDETKVDGSPGGDQQDGTFDDGGNGGACHRNDAGYAPYNTPGCVDDGARASGPASVAPWIAATCDWKWDHCDFCSPWPLDCSSFPNELQECLLDGLDCSLHSFSCYTASGFEVCGSDGVPDGLNFGPGGSRVQYPHASSQHRSSFTGDGLECEPEDAFMAVHVYEGVTRVAGGLPTLYPAVQGEIWQVD